MNGPSLQPLPPDNPTRRLSVVEREDPVVRHIGIVGDNYTILLTGADTAGRYCLIDMSVPHCGGPAPHRHDFEEMFTLLEGEIQLTFRGEKRIVRAGMTVNVPANAPHFFTRIPGKQARMLCMCTPPGLEQFFLELGTPLAGASDSPPRLTDEGQAAFEARAQALGPRYRTELLPPPERDG